MRRHRKSKCSDGRDDKIKKKKGYFKYLLTNKLKTKTLSACKSSINNLESCNATINTLNSQQANITSLTTNILSSESGKISNLNVDTINGYIPQVPCELPILESIPGEYVLVDRETQQKPPNPDPTIYNPKVYDQLWNFAVERINNPCFGLKSSLQCGRLGEKYYQKDCNICPPNQLTECSPYKAPSEGCPDGCSANACGFCPSGNCPSINCYIGAIQTINPITSVKCSNSDEMKTQILTAINYNLNVNNFAEDLGSRVVSVMIHYSYLESPFPNPIDIANKQFPYTYDQFFGEKFAGTFLIPNKIIDAYKNNKLLFQIVIYVEEDVAFFNVGQSLINANYIPRNVNTLQEVVSGAINQYVITNELNPNDWLPLGTDQPNAAVRSITFHPTTREIYIGGDFTNLGPNNANYVARLDNTTGQWQPIIPSSQPNNLVRVVAIDKVDKVLHIGGDFTDLNGRDYYAELSEDNEWVGLFDNPNAPIYTIAFNPNYPRWPDKTYIGGDFTDLGEDKANYMARDTQSQDKNRITPEQPNNRVSIISLYPYDNLYSYLYAGGKYTDLVGAQYLAETDLSDKQGWRGLIYTGNVNDILDLKIINNNKIYIAGTFTGLDGADNIALYEDGLKPITPNQPNKTVHSITLIESSDNIIIGGEFDKIGNKDIHRVAILRNNAWEPINFNSQPNNTVLDTMIGPDGKLYIAGDFTNLGSNSVTRIASFNI